MGIPLHLAMHVLGLTMALGLCAHAGTRMRGVTAGWLGLALGGLLLATNHLLVGMLVADPQDWPLLLRVAGYAGIAVGLAGGVRGRVAAIAFLPPAGHLAAAFAGIMAAAASMRGVLGRGRQVAVLTGGLVLLSLGDLAISIDPRLAAGASIAGSLAIGGWLVGHAAARSLFARIAGAFIALLLVLTVGIASASGLVYTNDLRDEQLRRLDGVAEAQARSLTRDWPAELAGTAELLSGGALVDELRDAAEGRTEPLDRRAGIIEDLPGVDLVLMLGPRGQPAGSARDGDAIRPADTASLAGDELVELARSGSSARGVVGLGDDELMALGATPVAPNDAAGEPELDRLAGVLLVGRSLTAPSVLAEIRNETGSDVAVVVDGDVTATTLRAGDDLVAALGGRDEPSVVQIDDEPRFVTSVALPGVREPELGRLALVLDPGAVAGAEATATRSLFAVALVALALAAALAALVARRTTRPVRRLTHAAERVAAGDLDARVGFERDDEVGRLATAFDGMTVALADREQALRQAAAVETALRVRLEAVTASMGEALLAVDARGRVTTANPAAGELLASAPGELVDRPLTEVLLGHTETGEPLVALLGGPDSADPAVVRGRVETVDSPFVREVAATAAPLRDADGGVHGRVYVVRDVTSEVEAERMKTELIANVSHELKTPLTPIRGYAELLRSRDVGRPRTVEFATQIVASVQGLERTVGLLVDLADLEAGRTQVHSQPTDLGEVVTEVLDDWRDREPDRRLTRRLKRGLPPVDVDPRLLRRVLEELVHNAMRFSDGPVRIGADRHGDTVTLTVRDTGAGFDEETQERVLGDFAQADGSATRRHGGLGLGLSIVQRILARSAATFDISSEPGDGTVATVRLPIATTPAPRSRTGVSA